MAIEDFLKLAAQNAQSDPMALTKAFNIGADIAQKKQELGLKQQAMDMEAEKIKSQYEQRMVDMFKYLGDDKVHPSLRKLAIPTLDKLMVQVSGQPMSDDAKQLFTSVPDSFQKFAKLTGLMQQAQLTNNPALYREASDYAQSMLTSSGSDLYFKYLGLDDYLAKALGSNAARSAGLKPEESIELKDATQLKSDAFKKLGEVNIGGKSGMDLFRSYLQGQFSGSQSEDQKKLFQSMIDITNGTLPQNLQTLPVLRAFNAEASKVLANADQFKSDVKELSTLRPDLSKALSDKFSNKINQQQRDLLQQAVKIRDVDMINMDPGARQKLIADVRGIAYDVLGKQAVEARVSEQAKDFRKETDQIYKDYDPVYSSVSKINGILRNPNPTALKTIPGQIQSLAEGVRSVLREGDMRIYGAVGGIFDRIQNRIDDFSKGESLNAKQMLEVNQYAKMIEKMTNLSVYSRLESVVKDAKVNNVPLPRVISEPNMMKYKDGEKLFTELKKTNFNENQIRTIEQMKLEADKSGISRKEVLDNVEKGIKRKLTNAERQYIISF